MRWPPSKGCRRNSRIPPQLEKRYVVPPSSQDEALAPYSISREVPRSVLKCAGRDWGQEEKGMTEDEMAGWHHCDMP